MSLQGVKMQLREKLALSLILLIASQAQGATIEHIWGKVGEQTDLLNDFSLVQTKKIPSGLVLPPSQQTAGKNILKFFKGHVDESKVSHVRYNQYYQDIPVWGAQVIYHISPKNVKTLVNGQLVKGIAEDVQQLEGKISPEQAKAITQSHTPTDQPIQVKKIIYLNKESNKAVLAYLVTYLAHDDKGPALPHFIIDANTGEILREWNALPHVAIGQGQGGFTFSNLSYRPGTYQFGTLKPGLNTLDKMNIIVKNNNTCIMMNSVFQIVNLKNQSIDSIPYNLPVSNADASHFRLTPFSYLCSAPAYHNRNDGNYAPVNGGFSPINDVMFFVNESYNMYVLKYGIKKPVGSTLPLRIYTHINDFSNAFACSLQCMRESGITGPAQLVFGNGGTHDAPFSDIGTSGHEFAHLVTDNFSALIYDGQSGGINEAFSDMGEFALKSYVKQRFPWIWDGKDWNIGLETSKSRTPYRYMHNPPLDGNSIDNARNYNSQLDVHYSSGVFNKAFYLLSNTPGWSVEKAFRVMLDANMNYWTPATTFNDAACGVIESAKARRYKHQDVVIAFQRVGVVCRTEAS